MEDMAIHGIDEDSQVRVKEMLIAELEKHQILTRERQTSYSSLPQGTPSRHGENQGSKKDLMSYKDESKNSSRSKSFNIEESPTMGNLPEKIFNMESQKANIPQPATSEILNWSKKMTKFMVKKTIKFVIFLTRVIKDKS